MFLYGQDTILSATDLVRFLHCPYGTYLSVINLDEPLEKKPHEEQTELLIRKGLEHEENYLQRLKSEGSEVFEVDSDGPIVDRAKVTQKAMAEAFDYLYQGTLLTKPWLGIADFLKLAGKGPDGPVYEAWDTKLSLTPSVGHVLQLCVYSELLRSVQNRLPNSMSLVLGDGTRAAFRCKDFAYYCRNAMQRLEAFVEVPPQASYPEPCSQCQNCSWGNLCAERWEEDDHLSLVANMRQSQIKKLEQAGIDTVRALSELAEDVHIPKLAGQTLSQLRSQARLQVRGWDTGEDHVEVLPLEMGRGFFRMPQPDPGDLFFDMEGDPLLPGGLEYLFGIYFLDDGVGKFQPFWAHDDRSEKEAFQKTMDFFAERLKQYPAAHIYHYAHYEDTALKRLASGYGTREAELDNLLRKRKLVDLYKVVRESIRISEPKYSLKNVETFYMEKRAGDVATATDSIVVYEQWRLSGDSTLLDQIQDYNEEDCRSTYLLREWLLTIRPEQVLWLGSDTEEPDEERTEKQREAEERRLEYEQKLLDSASPEKAGMHQLVAHLLEYHRREAKPQWWALFNRRDGTEEELIDDPECLGGLRLSPDCPPFPDKQSTIFTYAFPVQESKFKVGDGCHVSTTLEWAGTITGLDEDEQTVQIRRGNRSGPLPESLSVIPRGPIDDVILRKAIYRFADSLIAGERKHRALESLLSRDLPSIVGQVPGSPLVGDANELVDEVVRAVSGFQSSYLFIQGPPGAGKTYTASEVIVDLIRSGKKVGVSSNSHRAINNLLSAVEKKADEKGVSFRGVKKSTGGQEDSFFKGRFITDVTASRDVDLTADLIAGTAWLFAREEFDRELDYLFVDEAGQVSLANAIAMGLCARNVVLIGDPMQLAQPVQGVHPEESGQSVLEFLLQEQATIAPERGIFLPTTWRMEKKLCRFISDAVYDGRLEPEPKNQNQRLLLAEGAHSALKSSGISFVPVDHFGCSQRSEEEAEVLRGIFESLLNQRYQDRECQIRPMTPDNILVVSPYNIQVNYLKSSLPSGARVGTVDKFQGQEAEVVLISMTTSSGEDLPRHIEFLYSKNRLNVAISRARTLSIVLASPRLLEVQCSTVEQLKLVNTLCWAKSYAGSLGA